MFLLWLRLNFERVPEIIKIAVAWLVGISLFPTNDRDYSRVLIFYPIFWFILVALARDRRRVLLLGFIALLGFFRTGYYFYSKTDISIYSIGDPVNFYGRVISTANNSGTGRSFKIGDLRVKESFSPISGKVVLTTYDQQVLTEGDRVAVSGIVDPKYTVGTRSSAIVTTRHPNQEELYLKLSMVERLRPDVITTVTQFFSSIRSELSYVFKRRLPEPEASLAAGILLGQKNDLPNDFYNALMTTGLVHVVVASGYNISVITLIVVSIAGFLGRRPSLAVAVFTTLFYVFLSGGGPPIWRAFMMVLIFIVSEVLGRERDGLAALFGSATILTFFDPTLLYSVSFQLSFLATFGLFVFSGNFFDALQKLPFSFRVLVPIKKALAPILAVQLVTMPVIATLSSKYSLLSVLANTMILPVVSYITISSFLLIIVDLLVPTLATTFSWFTYFPLHYFVLVVSFLGSQKWSYLYL